MDKFKIINETHISSRYTEEFKRKVCEEYISSDLSKTELSKKYGIKGRSVILSWLRKFGYLAVEQKVPSIAVSKPRKKESANTSEVEELKARLRDAELKLEAYERIIRLAETELNIPIRKKSNTK